jgi:hypothetical protein
MNIKIVKSTRSTFWYNDRIGETFEVIKENSDTYFVWRDKNCEATGYVYKFDADGTVDDVLTEHQKMVLLLQWCLKHGFLNIGDATPESIVSLYKKEIISDGLYKDATVQYGETLSKLSGK